MKKSTQEEKLEKIKSIQNDISQLVDKRNHSNIEDLNYFKNKIQS